MWAEALEPLSLSTADLNVWRQLQRADNRLSSPYLTPEWAQTVNKYRTDARVVIIREDDGSPVGFLPVQASSPICALPLGGPICDYQAIVSKHGTRFDSALILDALNTLRVDFSCVIGDHSATENYLCIPDQGHVVRFPDGWSAYEEKRKEAGSSVLKRARKKLNRFRREFGNVTFESFVHDDDAFQELLKWNRVQHQETQTTDVLSRAWIRYIVEAVYAERGPQFGGELFLMRAGGELAAALFCIRAGKTLHAWFVGHNHRFDAYSPGLLLFVETIKSAAEAGYHELDLGPGDYRFKKSLANFQRQVGPGYLGGTNLASAWRSLQFSLRQSMEDLPLGALSHAPGKAMRRMDVWRSMAPSSPRRRCA